MLPCLRLDRVFFGSDSDLAPLGGQTAVVVNPQLQGFPAGQPEHGAAQLVRTKPALHRKLPALGQCFVRRRENAGFFALQLGAAAETSVLRKPFKGLDDAGSQGVVGGVVEFFGLRFVRNPRRGFSYTIAYVVMVVGGFSAHQIVFKRFQSSIRGVLDVKDPERMGVFGVRQPAPGVQPVVFVRIVIGSQYRATRQQGRDKQSKYDSLLLLFHWGVLLFEIIILSPSGFV